MRGKWALMTAGLLGAVGLVGCGKDKANGDYEPPPSVAAAPAPKLDPAPSSTPKEEPKPTPKTETTDPQPKPSVLPSVPPPFSGPTPKEPPKGDPSAVAPPPAPKPFVPPAPVVDKEPEKPMPKDPAKLFEWPTSINSRPMSEWLKDIDDPDPAIREQGLRTIIGFGPQAVPAATKAVLHRMNGANETDPGVRAAAFEAVAAFSQFTKDGGLEKEADNSEAIRVLTLSLQAGGATRLHAVNTLAAFGPRAAGAIPSLVGENMTKLERAYETRRAVATTLGAISFIKDTGPSPRALHCLTDVLIKDDSAAVRLAAYQSLVLLGPPYLAPPMVPPGQPKPMMKVDEKALEGYVKAIKAQLAPFKPMPGSKFKDSPTGLVEREKQVEVFARLALMRLDVKEINDENLNGITKYVTQPGPSGPKLQALSALGVMGESASRKINDVVKALEDEDPQVVTAAASVLAGMGKEGKPAIEFLEKLKKRGSMKGEKDAKDLPREYYEELASRAIKAINEAKPAPGTP
jgi:HEAT repeat protein